VREACTALAVCVALTIANGAAPAAADESPPSHIIQAELLLMMERGRPPAIVDVRSRREYDRGHVPGAVHIPFWAAFARADLIPVSHDGPVVVYSEHGPRAGLSKLAFGMRGFERVLYLDGHMQAWRKAGLPLQARDPTL
jgi:rhodanese-related sulfurtransferase